MTHCTSLEWNNGVDTFSSFYFWLKTLVDLYEKRDSSIYKENNNNKPKNFSPYARQFTLHRWWTANSLDAYFLRFKPKAPNAR